VGEASNAVTDRGPLLPDAPPLPHDGTVSRPADPRSPRLRQLQGLSRAEAEAVRLYESLVGRKERGVADRFLRLILGDHRAAAALLGERRGDLGPLGRVDVEAADPVATPAVPRRGCGTAAYDLIDLVELCGRESEWIRAYEEAVASDALDPGDRDAILGSILPRQKAHVSVLERLARCA
jgi:hypothetical protein